MVDSLYNLSKFKTCDYMSVVSSENVSRTLLKAQSSVRFWWLLAP